MIIEGGPLIEEIVIKTMPNSPVALVDLAPEHLRYLDPIRPCILLVSVPNCPYLMK